MNQEDYPSDSDASDEDFRPDNEEVDTGSELDTDDEIGFENRNESEEKSSSTNGPSKRKRKFSGEKKKKHKSTNQSANPEEKIKDSDEEKDKELDEDEEKRRTDALWADFLGGSSSSNSTSNAADVNSSRKPNIQTVQKNVTEVKSVPKPKVVEKEKPSVAQLFEFAGEQIVLTEEGTSETVDDSHHKQASKSTVSKALPLRGSGGGLGAVLNQISKKNKLSTLEKTKLDWTSFKRQEGIEEELQTHNKGKDGFLERRDFLDRTDLRQFEIEKSFRQTKRSNR